MFLSVIIPVRNEQSCLAGVLDDLLEQEYSGQYEIIVVDGLSCDDTPQIIREYCRKHPQVRGFENPKRLASSARNIGVKESKGEAVVFVDGHCVIDNKRMLACVAETFEQSGADCLARPQPLEPGRRLEAATALLPRSIAAARRSPLGHHASSFVYSSRQQFIPASSAAVAYRKSVFGKIGDFDETFDACEDVEFNTRCDKAGLKCYFAPATAVRYLPRRSLKGLAAQMKRYGQGRVRLYRKHPDTFSLKSFAPGFYAAAVAAGFLVFLPLENIFFGRTTLTQLYLAGVVIPYLAALVCESLRLAAGTSSGKRCWKMLPLLPVVFFTIHFGYAWGILTEFFGTCLPPAKR